MKFGDLVLCPSCVPTANFEEQIEAAAAAGYAGISCRPLDAQQAIERLGSPAAVLKLMRDAQVKIADMDPCLHWFPGGTASLPKPLNPGILPTEAVLDLADKLEARSVNVTDLGGHDYRFEDLFEHFAIMCERAKALGLLVHIEFHEGSPIKDMKQSAYVIEGAGSPANGGILLDSFHYHRGPSRPENQLPAYVDRVFMTQFSDAAAIRPETPQERAAERAQGRLMPGEGVADLAYMLTVLRDAGANTPLGLEVNSAEVFRMPPKVAAQKMADALRGILDKLPPPPKG